MKTSFLLISFLIVSFLQVAGATSSDTIPTFANTTSFGISDVLLQENVYIDCRKKALTLFVFLSPECPLCQNYTKTLNNLKAQFGDKVALYGIVPGNAYEAQELIDFITRYKVAFNIGTDRDFLLTKYLQATVTPQAILIDSTGSLIYKGAIDDWVTGLGKKRQTIVAHYVADAIQQSLKALPVKIKSTRSYGCKINDI